MNTDLYLNKFNSMPLAELEENAYALQIKYGPPLREKDRGSIVNEILWIVENRDKIDEDKIKESRLRKREREGKNCDQNESIITGEDLLLLSNEQLIFLPFYDVNGNKKYYCFTRYEIIELLKDNKNPYTNEQFSDNERKYIKNKLEKPYPQIPIYGIISEIDERIFGNIEEYKPKEYRELADKLVKIVDQNVKDFKSGIIYDFASKYKTDDYNLFLSHRGLRQKVSGDRDESSSSTLQHILNKYNLLYGINKDDARLFITEIAFAISEFMYMLDNKIDYQQLLEEMGKEAGGETRELYWKPGFMVEKYYDNGNIRSRYYLNDNRSKNGKYVKYDKHGNLKKEIDYNNGYSVKIAKIYKHGGKYYKDVSIYEGPPGDPDILLSRHSYRYVKDKGFRLYLSIERIDDDISKYSSYNAYRNSDELADHATLIEVKNIVTGNLIQKTEFNSVTGFISSDKFYKDGLLDGEQYHYDSKNNIILIENYDKGYLNGKTIEYYSTGNKKNEMIYEKGILKSYTSYYPNEIVKSVLIPNKSEEIYYKNGNIKSVVFKKQMKRKNGAIITLITRKELYYQNGNLKEIRDYSKGKIDGERILYREDGEVEKMME